MHHAIWVEHDGSWTWSIEEGKAFEDDHKVLARNDGFPTRGDAKEAMQKEWARLLGEGKKPGRPGTAKKPAKKPANAKAAASFAGALPTWAVIANGHIVAMFSDEAAARAYAGRECPDSAVQQLRIGAYTP